MIGSLLDILTSKLVRIDGHSMEPGLPHGSLVVISRRAYRWPRRPSRFDIVRFEDPSRPGHWSVKRIVGLPDERVTLNGGKLTVDDVPVAEPHAAVSIDDSTRYDWMPCTNEYVVLGDNRGGSTDSRRIGPVPAGKLTGKVTRRLR